MLRQSLRYFRGIFNLKKTLGIGLICIVIVFILIKQEHFKSPVMCQSDDLWQLNRNSRELNNEEIERLKQKWLSEQQQQQQNNPKVVIGDEPPNNDAKSQSMLPLECLINDDYSIQCLRNSDEKNAVYMPFSFIEKYFDVTGKIKHYDGYERFEFSQSYAKIVYTPNAPYSYHGGLMTFDSYNVEVRDRVKCISGIEGVPISIQWGPQGYFYATQIAQFGLSHYSKYLVEKSALVTVYENAENGILSKWKTSNHHCTVETVKDIESGNNVIKFSTPDYTPLGSGVTLTIGNTMEYVLSFDVKFTGNGSLSVLLETSDSKKQYVIHYVTTNLLLDFDRQSTIFYGIGPSKTWRHISRDLTTDLRKGIKTGKKPAKTKVSIRKVSRLVLRGEGYIDNITISKNARMSYFREASEWMAKNQDLPSGGWKNDIKRSLLKEGFQPLEAGWISAMGQGQAMSLLARAYYCFEKDHYIAALARGLLPFTVPSEKGGVRAVFMNTYVWYEEYPTVPSSFVLNGFIYSLIGLYDFKSVLEDKFKMNATDISADVEEKFQKSGVDLPKTYKLVSKLFNDGIASLKAMLPLYDGGTRTFYDLRHFVLKMPPNIARWDYHATHLSQLAWLSLISDDPIFKRYFDAWYGYMKGTVAPHN